MRFLNEGASILQIAFEGRCALDHRARRAV